MENDLEFVNVSIRIKPNLHYNTEESSSLQVVSEIPPVLLIRSQPYHFDQIYSEDSSQEDIYNGTVKHLVKYVKQGYSCTVLAYGQTGTGKTFTIGTDPQATEENFGLIPRALKQFLNNNSEDGPHIEISLSFIEIYNTKVFDLLSNDKVPLQVQGFKNGSFIHEKVYNLQEAKHFLEMGNRNRHIAETNQNVKSSRSHAIFTIYYKVLNSHSETLGKLNLVDLAGCESVKKTGSQGSTFHEGVNINKGLLAIGQVMTALSSNSSHIPYRQSLLTHILQDSLSSKNFISLIACVSSHPNDIAETMRTLDFSHRVKKIKNKPEVNEIITLLKKEKPGLFESNRPSCTPLKRTTTFNSFKTPSVAKISKPSRQLQVINEPSDNNGSSLESSADIKSLGSSGVSYLTNNTENHNLHFSPVIKKYMNALETNLMDRLENVIHSTLRSSSRNRSKLNIENTPSTNWDRLGTTVSTLVRKELAQLTCGTTSARATSSPINMNLTKLKKVLAHQINYQSFLSPNESNSSSINKSGTFKVPAVPINNTGNCTVDKRTPSLSPIDGQITAPRRSVRISMRKRNNNDSSILNNTDMMYTFNASRKRPMETISGGDIIPSKRRSSARVREKLTNKSVTHKVKGTKERLSIGKTPAGKRLMPISKDSPYTCHTKEVLQLLNDGNAAQLKKMPLIGDKSAQQIIMFRKLQGPIRAINDLSRMPGWKNGRCDRFMEYNFIKKA